MSYIAAALAKSKGKEVQPPPLESFPSMPGFDISHPPLAEQPREPDPARESKLKLAVIGGAVVLVALILAYSKWHSTGKTSEPPVKPAVATGTPPTESRPAPQPKAVVRSSQPAAPATLQVTAGTTSPGPAPIVIRPAEEMLVAVRHFSVSAVMSGPNGRARIDGKTYHIGDTVLPGLALREIRDGQLFFQDDAGASYSHRF